MTFQSFLPKLRLFLSAVPCFALASCFGAGVMYVKSEECPRFRLTGKSAKEVGLNPFTDEPDKGKPNPTRKELAASCGEPDKKLETATQEIWVYNTGMGICGLTPMVGIGIPLWLPGGQEGYDFYFERNEKFATKAARRTTREDSGMFSVFYDPATDRMAGFRRVKEE